MCGLKQSTSILQKCVQVFQHFNQSQNWSETGLIEKSIMHRLSLFNIQKNRPELKFQAIKDEFLNLDTT